MSKDTGAGNSTTAKIGLDIHSAPTHTKAADIPFPATSPLIEPDLRLFEEFVKVIGFLLFAQYTVAHTKKISRPKTLRLAKEIFGQSDLDASAFLFEDPERVVFIPQFGIWLFFGINDLSICYFRPHPIERSVSQQELFGLAMARNVPTCQPITEQLPHKQHKQTSQHNQHSSNSIKNFTPIFGAQSCHSIEIRNIIDFLGVAIRRDK
jgi:hypothetical protein